MKTLIDITRPVWSAYVDLCDSEGRKPETDKQLGKDSSVQLNLYHNCPMHIHSMNSSTRKRNYHKVYPFLLLFSDLISLPNVCRMVGYCSSLERKLNLSEH